VVVGAAVVVVVDAEPQASKPATRRTTRIASAIAARGLR
jgi:hypothetical protein